MATAASQAVSTNKSIEPESIIGFSPEVLQAPFVLRCAALSFDYMVLLLVPVGWLIWGKFFGEGGPNNTGLGAGVWFIGSVLLLINFLVLPLLRGQTLGKMLLGLTILKTDGTPIGILTVLKRNVVGYFVTVLTLGLGFLLSAVNSSGRALHDLIGGTVVVRGSKRQV